MAILKFWSRVNYMNFFNYDHSLTFNKIYKGLIRDAVRTQPLTWRALLTTHHRFYTYLLTPWCRVLLEKLTGLQLVKKFPAFLWNPKVHYRTHKRPPPVPILGQPNPVHIPTSHLLEIHPNIFHPSTPRSPQWSLSLWFPHQDPIHPPLLNHMPYSLINIT